MPTLLNKSYLVKGGEGSKISQILSTWFVQSPKFDVMKKALGNFTKIHLVSFLVKSKYLILYFISMNFQKKRKKKIDIN